MSTDRRESDSLLQPISSSSSTASIYSHLLTPTALLAQAGLLVFLYPIWTVLLGSELSLFSYHPLLNSLAVFFFIEGVVLLQPVKVFKKRESAKLHRTVQWIGLPIILLGTSLIIYNKLIHSAPHFASLHGFLGITTLSLILLQIIAGAVLIYGPLLPLVGGEMKAKSLWKFHRMSGYLVLSLLIATPLSAVWSDWVIGHLSLAERWSMGGGLGVVVAAVAVRINFTKWGLTGTPSPRIA